MKHFCILIFCCFAIQVMAQDTTYYDRNWQKTLYKDSASSWKVVKLAGADSSGRGWMKVYHSPAIPISELNYSNYKRNIFDGKCRFWYKQGQLEEEIEYKDGKRNGNSITYWSNGKVRENIIYDNEKIESQQCFTSSGIDTNCIIDVQTQPAFPGGDSALTLFIEKNTKYPAKAIKYNAQGKVMVQFIVEKDGHITSVTIKKFVEWGVRPVKKKKLEAYMESCEEIKKEATRLVNVMPNWSPGTQNGKPVRVYVILPIKFFIK